MTTSSGSRDTSGVLSESQRCRARRLLAQPCPSKDVTEDPHQDVGSGQNLRATMGEFDMLAYRSRVLRCHRREELPARRHAPSRQCERRYRHISWLVPRA